MGRPDLLMIITEGSSMATIRQRDSGNWQAIVEKKGHPVQRKTFKKKAGAIGWAAVIESEIERGIFVSRTEAEGTTFQQAADRYSREILPGKRGKAQDEYRIRTLTAYFGNYSLAGITPALISTFRDQRLKGLSAQSVLHELNMLSRIYRTAVQDWGIALPGGNPVSQIRKPRADNARDRRFLPGEEKWVLLAVTPPDIPGPKRNPWLLPITVFAVETAARQSEILSLDWKDVDLTRRFVRLRGVEGRETKNSDEFREVPLTSKATATLQQLLPRANGKVVQLRRGKVFGTTPSAIKQCFTAAVRRGRDLYERDFLRSGLLTAGMNEKAVSLEIRKVKRSSGRMPANATPPHKKTRRLVEDLEHDPMMIDLHFHDLRHEATSRLAEKLEMHELMKVTGHKSSAMLARYYHPRAEDLAQKLG